MKVGVVTAALSFFVAMLASMTLAVGPGIDHSSILRFIAPTAFETRSIEEILAGGEP